MFPVVPSLELWTDSSEILGLTYCVMFKHEEKPQVRRASVLLALSYRNFAILRSQNSLQKKFPFLREFPSVDLLCFFFSCSLHQFQNLCVGAGEMAERVRALLSKHEDLSSNLQHPHKKARCEQVHVCHLVQGWWGGLKTVKPVCIFSCTTLSTYVHVIFRYYFCGTKLVYR